MTSFLQIALAAVLLQNAASAPKPVAASIEGIVVKLGNGEPISDAGVELSSAEGASLRSHTAITTNDGKFRIKDIPAGEYRLAAARGGFVRSEYGQRSASGRGLAIKLEPGQEMKNTMIALIETGAIAGRIYGPAGAPIANAQVQALKHVYVNGRRVLRTVRGVVTDDLGAYRLFWLPPGDYFVMARPLQGPLSDFLMTPLGDGLGMRPIPSPLGAPILTADDAASVPFYSPAAIEPQSAATIHLRPGDDVAGVDVAIRPMAARRVSGRVTNLPGNLPPGPEAGGRNFSTLRVGLTSENVSEFDSESRPLGPGSTIDRATGSFEIPGVIPGRYYLTASVQSGNDALYARVPIEVVDDLDGVILPLAPAPDVAVHVSVDSGSGAEMIRDLSRLRIRLDAAAVAQPDAQRPGSFTFRRVRPGDYRVIVEQLPPAAYVKSMRAGEANLLAGNLSITIPSDNPIQIALSLSGGVISGTVAAEQQSPGRNATVVLVPDTPLRRRSDLYKTTSTDAAGGFRVTGISPGDYKVFAWGNVESGAWEDPEFIKIYEDRGQPIRVDEGTSASIRLIEIP